MKYLAFCISGLQDVVFDCLVNDVGLLVLLHKEEGLLLVEGKSSPTQMSSIRYLNNCHLLITQLEPTSSIKKAAQRLLLTQDWHKPLIQSVAPNERTFRVMFSDESQLVAGEPKIVAHLRSTIQRLTNMRNSPHKADVEFWLFRRRSNQIFLSKRLSQRSRTEKNLRKGELRPELAHLLCLLSEPQPNDIFLEPFAGNGAIPFARTYYPYNMIFAFDIKEDLIRLMKTRIKQKKLLKIRKHSPIIVRQGDAQELKKIENGFIDKVVTDPPWGFFDTSLHDLNSFYNRVVAEILRVIKTGGIIILLIGDYNLAIDIYHQFDEQLKLLELYKILVGGKKAVICKWQKKCKDSGFEIETKKTKK